MSMNICERFPYLYEYVYFTCFYLGRMFLDGYATSTHVHVYEYIGKHEHMYVCMYIRAGVYIYAKECICACPFGTQRNICVGTSNSALSV